jgi:hypothetical protein
MATFHRVSPITTVCVGVMGLSARDGDIAELSAEAIAQHRDKIIAQAICLKKPITPLQLKKNAIISLIVITF